MNLTQQRNPVCLAMTLLISIFVSLMSGCAQKVSVPSLPLLKLTPASFGSEIELQQRMEVTRDGTEPQQLEALLTIDASHVHLVGLAFGQRVLTLDWDGKQLDEKRHPMLPSEVKGERVLSDIMLMYWPRPSLEAAMPEGWRLEENETRRTLFWHDTPQVVIDYQDNSRYKGAAVLRQLTWHYQLTIDSTAP